MQKLVGASRFFQIVPPLLRIHVATAGTWCGWAASLILLLSASQLDATEPPTYRELLIHKALSERLDQDRQWLLLLHYKRTWGGGYESEEDGPDFFLAADGKTAPRGELVATIGSFFKEPALLAKGEEHPQCVFPARYYWLKQRLSFDSAKLPEVTCERLQSWRETLNPGSVTLIFASYYLNNPASMFGHTLLRIDTKRTGAPQTLLDYGVNYAATTDTGNALAYALKGLFGFFKGTFTIFPYYMKVQTYSNFESRDLWEYQLNLTDDQIEMLLLHLWELGGNYFDYYYFQENCSYHILSVLETANPELDLTDRFFFSVIPSDTVKAVVEQPGLVSERVYRPSLISRMSQKTALMTDAQLSLFYHMAENPSPLDDEGYGNLSKNAQVLILDALLDLSQFKTMRESKDPTVIDPSSRLLLLERSRLGQVESDERPRPQFSTPPEEGHGTDRFHTGVGAYDGEWFEELGYRPGYHDLLAKEAGYGGYSQILFFDTTLRYYHEAGLFRLDKLGVIDITSLSPYDPLFRKLSWSLFVGVDTIKDIDCRFCNSLKGDYGAGLSLRPWRNTPLVAHLLLHADAEASTRITKGVRIGGGATGGLLFDATDNWRWHVEGQYFQFPIGNRSVVYEVGVSQRYAVGQNVDIRAGVSWLTGEMEWSAGLNIYF